MKLCHGLVYLFYIFLASIYFGLEDLPMTRFSGGSSCALREMVLPRQLPLFWGMGVEMANERLLNVP